MISYYQHPSVTVRNLEKARDLLSEPGLWHQGGIRSRYAMCMVGACYAVGVPALPQPEECKLPDGVARSDLARGTLPEEMWFLRQAIMLMDPQSDGTIAHWNDDPARQHDEVMSAFDLAAELAGAEVRRPAVAA